MSERTPDEQRLYEEIGEREGEQRGGAEGGGGATGEESFTIGGPRGRDAERGEYDQPQTNESSDDG